MKIPMLSIQQTFAKTGIAQVPPEFEMTQPVARANVAYNHPELNIDNPSPAIELNWRQVWSDLGLKRPLDQARSFAQKGLSKSLDGIRKIAQMGDQLADIASGESRRLAQVVKNNYYRDNAVEVELVALPRQGPEVTVHTGTPQVDYIQTRVTVDPNSIEPAIRYQPGKVNVYLQQKESVNIAFYWKEVDIRI